MKAIVQNAYGSPDVLRESRATVNLTIIIIGILWAIASVIAALAVELRGTDASSTLASILHARGRIHLRRHRA